MPGGLSDELKHNLELAFGPANGLEGLTSPDATSTFVCLERAQLESYDVSPSLNHLFDKHNRPQEALQELLEHFDMLEGFFTEKGVPGEAVAAILDGVGLQYEGRPVSQLPLEYVWQATQDAFFKGKEDLYSAELRPVISGREKPDDATLEFLQKLGSRHEVALQDGDIGSLVFFGATASSIHSRFEFLANQLESINQLEAPRISELVLLGGERGVLPSDKLEIFQSLDAESDIKDLTDLPFIRASREDDDPRFKERAVVREAEMVTWIYNKMKDRFPSFTTANEGQAVVVHAHQTTLEDIGPGRNISAIDTVNRWLKTQEPRSDTLTVVGQQPYMYRQVAQVLGECIREDLPLRQLRGIGFGAQNLGECSLQELMKDLTVKIDLYKRLLSAVGEKMEG